jgi:sterol 14alpha-demethylase
MPGGLPFVGQALALFRDPVAFLRRARDRYGDQVSFPLMGNRVTYLSGPAAHDAVFSAPADILDSREAYQFMVPVFGKGVAYDVLPDVMDQQLGMVFPALRDDRLRRYAQYMAEEVEAYFEGWGSSGEVDLMTAFNELTVFIASRTLIGHEFRRALTPDVARLWHDLERGINLVAFFRPNFPIPAHFRRDRARDRIKKVIHQIIAERRASGAIGEDFLQTLMEARYQDGRALSDDEIGGMLLTLVFAGQHTSTVLASWTGVLLLQHPTAMEAVLHEQREVFSSGSEMTLERIRHMAYLERVLKEALRMYPPLVMLMRKAMRDFEHDGRVTPAGDLAMVSPGAAHYIPEVFARPERFDPDRFGPGREEDKKHKYALIGFGGGRHRCIGATFALQQVRVIWSILLKRFDIELVDRAPRPDYATFVVGPCRPCRMRYRAKRKAQGVAPTRAAPAPDV